METPDWRHSRFHRGDRGICPGNGIRGFPPGPQDHRRGGQAIYDHWRGRHELPSAITDQHPQVPWRQMRDMRNVVVHAYFGVNAEVLWDTVRNDLPPLVEPLKAIMR